MGKETRQRIIEGINQHGFCIVAEVTNGLSRRKLGEKVGQAVEGKEYIQWLTGRSFPVQAGIIFFRSRNLRALQHPSIDFLLQIPSYERARAIEALKYALERSHESEKPLAREILSLVKDGANLEEILYAAKMDQISWLAFQRRHPQLAAAFYPDEYSKRISGLKGLVLEEYARILCTEDIPEATIYSSQRCTPRREIDLVILGPQEIVEEKIRTSKRFVPHYSSSPKTSSS